MIKSKQLYGKGFLSKPQDLVIDAELLVLYLVGRFDLYQIKRYPQTEKFTVKAYTNLVKVIRSYRYIVITQGVLAEAFNHLDRLNRQTKYAFFEVARNILLNETIDRSFTTKNILDNKIVFLKSGLQIPPLNC